MTKQSRLKQWMWASMGVFLVAQASLANDQVRYECELLDSNANKSIGKVFSDFERFNPEQALGTFVRQGARSYFVQAVIHGGGPAGEMKAKGMHVYVQLIDQMAKNPIVISASIALRNQDDQLALPKGFVLDNPSYDVVIICKNQK